MRLFFGEALRGMDQDVGYEFESGEVMGEFVEICNSGPKQRAPRSPFNIWRPWRSVPLWLVVYTRVFVVPRSSRRRRIVHPRASPNEHLYGQKRPGMTRPLGRLTNDRSVYHFRQYVSSQKSPMSSSSPLHTEVVHKYCTGRQ